MQLLKQRVVLLCGAALLGCTSLASADTWNERTTLTFSAPVMVPGATLPAGTYEFALAETSASRHIVRIRGPEGKVIATTQAMPIKRLEAKGETTLRFSSTDVGVPPAIKAWFYPNSVYGHEFVYPEDQARQIAARTKTVVLAVDVPGSDLQKGTLRTLDPSGSTAAWRGDDITLREWDAWQGGRRSTASVATERSPSTATLVRSDFQGTRVELDDLEDNPQKYLGQTISVDGEVEDVFGPRLFTIDEPNWGDLDGEILVFMPTALAALVRDDDRVTVTGTLKPFVRAEVEREWGWLGLDPEVEVDLARKPVLVATRIVGGGNNVSMVIETAPADKPVGTAGSGAGAPLTQLNAIADGDEDLVGRHVTLNGVAVAGTAEGGGFFVREGGDGNRVFVLPAPPNQPTVRSGEQLTIEGRIAQMPDRMEDRLKLDDSANDDIYIYATTVKK